MNKFLNLTLLISFTSLVACTDMPGDSEQELLSESDEPSALEGPAEDVIASATTGGCTGARPISSCISRSGNFVVSDFYMNVPPDSSYWSYTVDITRSNSSTQRVASGRLDHQGRYGAWQRNIATLPITRGCSTTVVSVFTSRGVFHLSNTSPQVCY